MARVFGCQGCGHGFRRKVVSVHVHVAEHWMVAGQHDRVGARHPRERRHDDIGAGRQAQDLHRQVQSVRAAADHHGVLEPQALGKFLFKGRNLGPGAQPLLAHAVRDFRQLFLTDLGTENRDHWITPPGNEVVCGRRDPQPRRSRWWHTNPRLGCQREPCR